RSAGPRLLVETLELAERRSGVADQVRLGNGVDVGRAPDRLLVDLGERLWKLGYLVETDYGAADGDRIPLVVGHPDLPGELLVAVLTDDAAYVAEPSVRVRDRQLAERLERLGWVVTQVWSAAAFLDPDGEADRVRRLVQRVRDERIGTAGGVVPPREVVVPVLPDEDEPPVDLGGTPDVVEVGAEDLAAAVVRNDDLETAPMDAATVLEGDAAPADGAVVQDDAAVDADDVTADPAEDVAADPAVEKAADAAPADEADAEPPAGDEGEGRPEA
ncbi:MAG TPA: hypothetical protein VN027_06375, partial [Isoptericola sp.]|nr:hypothetical protein [Isoptericola sp.]